MQTFLPYADFEQSARILDRQRLNAMRRESKAILTFLGMISAGNMKFINQPIVKQWYGYRPALLMYQRAIILEWIARGYNNNMDIPDKDMGYEQPGWLGHKPYHYSHKAVLVKKAKYQHALSGKPLEDKYDYRHRWPDIEPKKNLDYVWPISRYYIIDIMGCTKPDAWGDKIVYV